MEKKFRADYFFRLQKRKIVFGAHYQETFLCLIEETVRTVKQVKRTWPCGTMLQVLPLGYRLGQVRTRGFGDA